MPEQPDFREILLDQLAVTEPAVIRPGWNVPLRLSPELAAVVRQAALERDLAVSTYARRAVVSFAARDTGRDYADLMANEGRVLDYGQTKRESGLGGAGHGDWVILELGSGAR